MPAVVKEEGWEEVQGRDWGRVVREVVTWNMQKLSLRQVNRSRLRRVMVHAEMQSTASDVMYFLLRLTGYL